MRKIIFFVLILSPFLFFFSCTHQPILPDEQVGFQHDIYPILLSSCQQSGCHDTLGNESFPLISYSDVMHDELVVPGKPKKSRIYQVVTTATGESFMPRPPYPPLSNRQIKLLYIWIAQGAKDN